MVVRIGVERIKPRPISPTTLRSFPPKIFNSGAEFTISTSVTVTEVLSVIMTKILIVWTSPRGNSMILHDEEVG